MQGQVETGQGEMGQVEMGQVDGPLCSAGAGEGAWQGREHSFLAKSRLPSHSAEEPGGIPCPGGEELCWGHRETINPSEN